MESGSGWINGSGTDTNGEMSPHGLEHIFRIMAPLRIEMKNLSLGMEALYKIGKKAQWELLKLFLLLQKLSGYEIFVLL